MTSRAIAIIVIAVSTVLLQIHSIQFWTAWTGAAIGWAWSIALEVAALWLWHRGGRVRVVAVLASALLIGGPFYEVSAPVWESVHHHHAQQALITLAHGEVAQLEASLARYDDNSGERLGWAQRIDRTQQALDAARERLRSLTAESATTRIDWRTYAVAGMQAAALVVVMVTQILAVVSLRPPRPMAIPAPVPLAPNRREEVETAVTDYDRLIRTVSDRLETAAETQKAIAAGAGVRPADVSMLRNHASRLAAGKEIISEAALRKLAAYLEPQTTMGRCA